MADVDAALTGGNYEVLRARLGAAGKELAAAETLNARRKALFGTTEPQLIATERVRTEHNCAPVDIVGVGEHLLLGYNVFLGLKAETKIGDVLALHRFEKQEGAGDGGFDTSPLPQDALGGFLTGAESRARLREPVSLLPRRAPHPARQARRAAARGVPGRRDLEGLQGPALAHRARRQDRHVDDRGERDYAALIPAPYDFEWREVTRENQVAGKHPHYNILDEVFVEVSSGRSQVKVEDNTETGKGIYSEPVDDANQTLDDAKIYYAAIGKPGGLIVIKVLPFRETAWRYLVFDPRSRRVVRADGIGQGCRSLPEDHGIVFPGGYVLVGGDHKLFDQPAPPSGGAAGRGQAATVDGDNSDYVLEHTLRSPNGEDSLYVYHRGRDGTYLLYTYNLIEKAISAPVACRGYSLFADGRTVIMRNVSAEPTRVHPMQVWHTPFTSAEFAASAPTDGSYLGKVGNADLVRGLSDAIAIARLANAEAPQRTTFDDILQLATRATDAYYWLGHADACDLKSAVAEVKRVAKLILDEYDKVIALEAEARRVLAEIEQKVADRLRDTRSEGFDRVEPFLETLTGLRSLRGELITKKEVRFIDGARLVALEGEIAAAFERVTVDCAAFLAKGDAFGELVTRADALAARVAELQTAIDVKGIREDIDRVATGVDLLGGVIGSLKIADTTKRTTILENITDAFGRVNRARATIEGRYRELATKEGRAEFGAQVKLLAQSVASGLAQCDTPERCDAELTRLLVQLQELEGRFADIDELTAELVVKREEIVEAVGARKQLLAAERQRRASNLGKAAARIIEGVGRRAAQLATADEVNAYFASDAMVQKLRDIAGELGALGDAVKADELEARLKAARQDALRNQRDQADLFEGGSGDRPEAEGRLIRFGEHRFSVNTQPLELMIVPHEDGLAIHLTGTDYYEPIDDPRLLAARALWSQDLPSENADVYRGEYLAASVLADADAGRGGVTRASLLDAARAGKLEDLLRAAAQERYDEGYERGVHDADAAKILERLLAMREGAGMLAHPAAARALGVLYWGTSCDGELRARWTRSAKSLARLAETLGDRGARGVLAEDIARAIAAFVAREQLAAMFAAGDVARAATYLVHELAAPVPRFVTSGAAAAIVEALHAELAARNARIAFDEDLAALASAPAAALALARAWVDGVVATKPELAGAVGRSASGSEPSSEEPARAQGHVIEAAALLATPGVPRQTSSALVEATVTGLLGRHARITGGALTFRLDELTARLDRFRAEIVPAFRAHRAVRIEIAERERKRLRISELTPRVMSSFVRNQLIDQAYLPLVGANLAKQLGAAGSTKRTDQMGMLLLVSPPGYGKTTLMEYVAARLGLAFVKVNGPALGHGVTSLNPADAPNATARQEIEKVSFALELGTNVMLYLDDIQHTSPELLQKFISLCDAQRKIEGVWRGKTRTYDLRGKKMCVVMAGNPYTESGETFRIPDMLANRADVYNLGDVLSGKRDAFALSFLENALTSNPTLAPLATRDLADVYKIIRMAKGEPIPTTELAYGYSGVELAEILAVVRHLFVAQETLLAVNAEYIRSAAQADAYRTEPPFKLQGSYRNMNKIAEKVVSAMTAQELDAVVDDHYRNESQTLTTAAEQNLLKLGELRQRLAPDRAARWSEIKSEYLRQRRMGGGDADPVTRLVGTLSGLGADLTAGLGTLRDTIGGTKPDDLTRELRELREALLRAVMKQSADAAQRDPEGWLGPRLDALAEGMRRQAAAVPAAAAAPKSDVPKGAMVIDAEKLLAQVRRLEQSLGPVISAAADQRGGDTLLANKMVQIIELLEQLDARLDKR